MATAEITALDQMEYLFICLKENKTSAGRREEYLKMVGLYKESAEVRDWWRYCPSTHFYVDRFTKLEQAISVTPPNKKVKAFDDGIEYHAPSCDGLYFIGETHFNPITKEEYYWVKIGKARNIEARLKEYNTTNPMLWRIDFNLHDYDREKYYHKRLEKICLNKCNHNAEWFLVDKDTYLKMCEEGFAFFG